MRIAAIESALPRDWREIIRSHPFLSLVAAAVVGAYLGRNHGREVLAAASSAGIAVGTARLQRAAR
jgi:hypothetical protein